MADPSVAAEFRFDAFFSYADENRDWVEGYLLDALDQAGVQYEHRATFVLGKPQILEFERAIRQSRATVLVISRAYFASSGTEFIDTLAMTFGTESGAWPVIPLRLEECELPPRLKMLTGLDAIHEHTWPEAVERLCRALRRAPPPLSPRPACPYPGMRPFAEDEADRFFGREKETEELLQRLRMHPFAAVIGPSGSGKSSLVSAALLPALSTSGLFGPGGWTILRLRPGEKAMSSLEAAMGGSVEDATAAVKRVLAGVIGADKVLLFVDQLEEIFTSAGTEEQDFERALVRLARAPGCFVVTTMRADFYPQLMTSPLWEAARDHRLEVLPLQGQALRQAIERPAERVGVFIESALVERLLADAAGEPGLLPLIQETLVCLWERLERRFLPLSAYEALVMPRSAYGQPEQTGLQVAMARRADEAMARLADGQRVIARRTLLRLVQFGVGRNDVRRQQPVSALCSAGDDEPVFEGVLDHLAKTRLVTVSASGADHDERLVDLAHEALIRGWPTFQSWVRERRAGEQIRRRLSDKAQEWERLGRETGGLLDPVELLEAERWIESADAPELGVDREIVDLVAASRSAIDLAEEAQESARQRELAHANALAEEQRTRAREQTAAARQARRLAVGMAVFLALVVVASAVAVLQRNRAQDQQSLAASRALAGEARALVGRRLDLALLLSIEAYRKHPTAEARASLNEAVTHDPRIVTYLVGPVIDQQHPSLANSVAFSPDGRLMAAAGDDDIIVLWDTSSGRMQGSPLAAHPGYDHPDDFLYDVRSIAFSSDGRVLAAAGNDAHVWLWDVGTGNQLRAPLGGATDPKRHEMRAVAFHPADPSVLASGNLDGSVVVWDLRAGQAQEPALQAPAGVNDVAFSPDGRLLAAASDDGSVAVWDLASGQLVAPPLAAHDDRARAVAFSPDGRILASSGNDRRIVFSDPSAGQPLGEALKGHRERVYDVAFNPAGTKLASASADGTARIWDLAARRADGAPLETHGGSVSGVAFAPDGRTVATTSRDRTTILWDLDRRGDVASAARHEGKASAVAMSGDGRFVASGGEDRTVLLVDQSGAVTRLEGFDEPVTGVAFSPDSRRLAASSWDGRVLVWDVASRRLLFDLRGDSRDGALALAFGPDGQVLAAGGVAGVVRLWDLTTGALRRVLHGPDRPGPGGRSSKEGIDVEPGVRSLAFAPDGTLVAGALHGGVWRWDSADSASDGARLTPWGHFVYSVAITPDGRSVISGAEDGTISLWDLHGRAPQARPRVEYQGQEETIVSLAVSSDRRTLASGSTDGTIALWDIPSARLLVAPFHAGTAAVNGVAFGHDGKRLASVGDSPQVSLRNLDPRELVRRACQIANHNLLESEWRVFLDGTRYHSTCPGAPR